MFVCRRSDSTRVSLDGATEHTIISFFLYHGPQKWTPRRHWNMCGQSCPCCRTAHGEIFGGCPVCEDGVAFACANRTALALARAFGSAHKDVHMHCGCGQCKNEWLHKGWICPILGHTELVRLRHASDWQQQQGPHL